MSERVHGSWAPTSRRVDVTIRPPVRRRTPSIPLSRPACLVFKGVHRIALSRLGRLSRRRTECSSRRMLRCALAGGAAERDVPPFVRRHRVPRRCEPTHDCPPPPPPYIASTRRRAPTHQLSSSAPRRVPVHAEPGGTGAEMGVHGAAVQGGAGHLHARRDREGLRAA